MADIGAALTTLGVVGLLVFIVIYMITERKLSEERRWLKHGGMSIERRVSELKSEGFLAYVARNCHFKLHEQRSVYNASTKSTHKEGAVLHGVYRVLIEVNQERIVCWKTVSFQDFSGFNPKWPLEKIQCHKDFEIPLNEATRLEIAPFSESDHRATSDSFYIYMVSGGKTYTFAQDTTMKDVRELRVLLQEYIDDSKGTITSKPQSAFDDDGVPT